MSAFVKTDFHVHPNYSFDATHEPIDDYCRRALELGLTQICFTPHYTSVPEVIEKYGFVRKNGKKFPVLGDWLSDYIQDVGSADKKFSKKGLRVFSGLEIDYDTIIHDDLKKRLTVEHNLDYMLGSVHIVHDGLDIMVPGEANDIFGKMSIDAFFDIYFANVEKTIDSGLFKCMAHLEGYRRYGTKENPEYGDAALIPFARFERVFKKMAARSMVLEINLSLFRHGLNIINPVESVLKVAKDCGITHVTIGSDAHRVADLAGNIDFAERACKDIGFNIFTL